MPQLAGEWISQARRSSCWRQDLTPTKKGTCNHYKVPLKRYILRVCYRSVRPHGNTKATPGTSNLFWRNVNIEVHAATYKRLSRLGRWIPRCQSALITSSDLAGSSRHHSTTKTAPTANIKPTTPAKAVFINVLGPEGSSEAQAWAATLAV